MAVMLYDAVYGLTGALFWGVAVHRLYKLIRYRSKDSAAMAVFAAFGFTAAAFTFAVPAVYRGFDQLVGLPNAATLGVYVCILLTAVHFLVLLAVWTDQPRARIVGWVVVYLIVIVGMMVLFVTGHPEGGEHPIDFDAHYAATLSQFLLLYYVGFAIAMAGTAWLSHRYGRMVPTGRPWLARGLRWTSVGAVFALGYCLLKVVAVLGIILGVHTQALSTVWAPLSATSGALIMATGLSMPGWGPGTSETVGRVLACYQLYPMWRLLTDAVPSVVLEPPSSSWWMSRTQRWALRDTKHVLYRRSVEIHDARLALGPWLDPRAGEGLGLSGGEDGHECEAAREAVMLVDAARAKAAGSARSCHRHRCSPRDHVEWDEQLRWLLAVARELRRLPGLSTRQPRNGAVSAE